jgi:hypothetical protein
MTWLIVTLGIYALSVIYMGWEVTHPLEVGEAYDA